MSLCEDTLLCNFPKCRGKLSGFAWVTACSHVFCDQHGAGEFGRSPAVCPACSNTLSGKLDIVRTELSPSEEYKAMVLAGLRPETVLDISSRALTFWTYQVHQERLYQEFAMSRAEGHVRQVEKLLSQQSQSRELELSAMREEVNCLKKMLEEYKRKYSEVSERLMERNRQYQKLQGMYDSLRLRSMVGEREASQGTEYSAGTVRYHTPRQSPGQAGMEGDSRGHHSFLSALENDSGKTGFFQFISPVRHSQAYKGPPRVFTKTH
ncbi:E3 ubiquitin-protein ligase CCNB1IP1 isoform X2 [Amia ocellicauda]|uniref:E3 ubiquitin-protein ligase CCNB1IP1 isoform X2 n=1 Tax=Amia ocellicauda TaxID=2972642 RepID=UPI003463AA45